LAWQFLRLAGRLGFVLERPHLITRFLSVTLPARDHRSTPLRHTLANHGCCSRGSPAGLK
jgi:hypothetical protein